MGILRRQTAFVIMTALICILGAANAWAVCSNPAGTDGEIEYFSNRYQFCDNTNWQTMIKSLEGPYVHYKFDESSGTTASDSAGETDGALINTPTWKPTGGKIGGSISFDSASSELMDVDTFGAAAPFSISFWIKGSYDGNWNCIACPDSSTGIWMNTANYAVRVYDRFGSNVLDSEAVTQNAWAHIVITDDGTTSRIYVDNVEKHTTTSRIDNGYSSLAGEATSSNYYWPGELDDWRVYNRVLSTDEISEIYNLTDATTVCSQDGVIDFSSRFKVCKDGYLYRFDDSTVGAACSNLGGMRYNASEYEYCDGSNWTDIDARQITEPTSGLIHHWKFDETSGTTASDSVGTEDGTLENSPTWQTTGGKIGGAIEFNASSEEVQLDSGGITLSTPVTYALWIKRTAANGSGNWAAIWTPDTNTGIWFDNSEDSVAGFPVGGGNPTMFGYTPPLNEWVHVAVTDDGTTGRVYMNGKEIDNNDNGSRFHWDVSYFGNANNVNPFTGLIDDARIYNRVLTADEIEDLYLSAE